MHLWVQPVSPWFLSPTSFSCSLSHPHFPPCWIFSSPAFFLVGRFAMLFMKDARPQPSMVGKDKHLCTLLFFHSPSAFMFELGDTKQERSEMLNCSTKDQPAMQLGYCRGLLCNTMLWLTTEWLAFSLQKRVPVFKKGCNLSYLVKVELTEFKAESYD